MKCTIAVPTDRVYGYPFYDRLNGHGVTRYNYLYYSGTGCAVFEIECEPEIVTLLVLKLSAKVLVEG